MRNEIIKLSYGRWKFIALTLVIMICLFVFKLYFDEKMPELEKDIISLQQAIEDNNAYIAVSDDVEQVNKLKKENDVYKYCKKNNVVLDRGYVGTGVYEAIELMEMEYSQYSYTKKDIQKGKQIAYGMLVAVKNKNFRKYIEHHLEAVSLLKLYSEKTKELERKRSSFWLKLDSKGEYNFFCQSLVSYYYQMQESLQEGKNLCYVDGYGEQLTDDEKKILGDRVKVLEFCVEKGYLKNRESLFSANTILKNMYFAGNMVIFIFLLYLATTAFGGEIERGTIKNVLISPNSRRQIYSRKVIALLIINVSIHMLVCGCVSVIGYGILGKALIPELFITDAGVKEMNILLSAVFGQFLQIFESIVWIALAVFISLIFENRGVSTIIVSLFYFVSQYMGEIFEGKNLIIKYFLPSHYGNIVQRVFSVGNFETDYLCGTSSVYTKCPMWLCFFCVVVCGCLFFLCGSLIFQKKEY